MRSSGAQRSSPCRVTAREQLRDSWKRLLVEWKTRRAFHANRRPIYRDRRSLFHRGLLIPGSETMGRNPVDRLTGVAREQCQDRRTWQPRHFVTQKLSAERWRP